MRVLIAIDGKARSFRNTVAVEYSRYMQTGDFAGTVLVAQVLDGLKISILEMWVSVDGVDWQFVRNQ